MSQSPDVFVRLTGTPIMVSCTRVGSRTDTPVLLIHGSGPGASGMSNFEDVAEALAQAGYYCIVPDIVGYGDSWDADWTDTWFDRTGPKIFDKHIDSMFQLLDALGVERCAIVGNSQGGAIALRMAADCPNRVSSVSLIGPGGLGTASVYGGMPGVTTTVGYLFPDGNMRTPPVLNTDTMRDILRQMTHRDMELPHQLISERLEAAKRTPIQKAWAFTKPGVWEILPNVTCPVQVVWGIEDRFCPVRTLSVLQSGLRNPPEIKLYSDTGHWVHVEQRDDYLERLSDFLRRQAA